ncbi:MAG: ABC transporter permease [Alphaproteobacteria bacterium]|nr:ABC transporter permease [Alphaproteobacteria bacterium]
MRAALLPLMFARRELRGGLKGFYVFLACLVLGVGAIAAVGSIAAAIEAGLRADARIILGGDVEIRLVHREASAEQRQYLSEDATVSHTVEMRAMARPGVTAAADARPPRVLIEMKAVDDAYPLFGAVRLEPDLTLEQALAPDGEAFGAVVDRNLLSRLEIALGDRIQVGEATFVVRATIETEPDRGAQAFTLGPRLMTSQAGVAATRLIQPGSLVRYYYRLRFDAPTDIPRWIDGVRARFPEAGWRVRDPAGAAPRIRRFVDRVGMFLTLVGLTALLVGGVGAANATKNYLDGRAETIATLKCLGAPGHVVFRTYLVQVLVLAGLAVLGGLAMGVAAPLVMIALYGDELPVAARAGIYPGPLLLAALFGVLTAVAFSVWPLARAREIPGARLFRDLVTPMRRWPRPIYMAACGLTVLVLVAVAIFTAHDQRIAIWFVLAAAGTLIAFRGAAWLAARAGAWVGRQRRVMNGRPGLRLALANLHRPGSPTPSVVLSLGIGLTVLVAVAQIQGNLAMQVDDRLPESAPSFYFVDIQPNQVPAFDNAVDGVSGAEFIERVPSLRGRIVRIAGVPVEQATIAQEVQWTVQNERGLTYAKRPPPGSVVTTGEWWREDYAGPPIISLDEKVARGYGVGIGDTLTVNILGRNLEARIANLRRIDWSTLAMNFVIIFAPGTLETAPHSHIATARTELSAEDSLLDEISDRFPNVSAIRVKDALEAVNRILERIGVALRATTGITLAAGTLVLAGAVAAGHRRRVYDSVVLKVLGATRRTVLRAYLLEYGLLGLATAVIAALLGTGASFLVMTEMMDFEWVLLPRETLFTVVGATAITVALGFFGVWRALGQKASPMLRNQ